MTHTNDTVFAKWMQLPWDAIVVHFSEIALKGGNRKRFTERLQYNIQRLLRKEKVKVSSYHDRLLIRAESAEIPALLTQVSKMFGVSSVSPVRIIEPDFNIICQEALACYNAVADPGATFALRVKRADKTFPMKSLEIERNAGGYVKQNTGTTVSLSNPDVLLKFRINKDSIYQEGPPFNGPDGLPVGTAGKVLNLFSGGIDSPVAAWMSLKRGCFTDFIHYHTYPSAEKVADTKIYPLIREVIQPQGLSCRLFLVPYHPFEMGLLSSQVPRDFELVLFRRFMVRVANEVAKQKKYSALITGDNLGQVASQTMGNLVAFDDASTIPVFRPLIMANKNDIINIAKSIGTYEASIETYKDCCSLVASGPQTNPKLRKVLHFESRMPVDEMVAMALSEMSEHIVE